MARFTSIFRCATPVFMLCVAFGAGCSKGPAPTPLPEGDGNRLNLLLITVDTLRADHLGCYGYGPDTSPAIDALAGRGTLFEQAMAPRGVTWPSLASLMTSLYPVGHGVRMNGVKLTEGQTTLAEILKAKGYACNALLTRTTNGQLYEGFERNDAADDEALTTQAARWIAQDRDGPFFLWLHLFGPHGPYAPPAEYAMRFSSDYTGPYTGETGYIQAIAHHQKDLSAVDLDHLIALYDASIAYTSDLVGGLLETLAERGLDSSTLVVFGSDHGDDLYDHNKYFYHKASVYDSVLHVPLIFSLPGTVREGRRVSSVVEQIDIAPTILELLGFSNAPTFEGSSLVPLLRGESVELGPAYSEWEDAIVSMRTDRFRYVLNPAGFHPPLVWTESVERFKGAEFYQAMIASGEFDTSVQVYEYPIQEIELYDLDLDRLRPVEDLDAYGAELKELNRLLVEWQNTKGWKLLGGINEEVDAKVREELEALGYVF